METTAVRLYGKNDLRLERFSLPEIRDDEILMEVIADSLCMSSWKAVQAGADHKRVPDNVAENPVIVGHEMSGKLVKVGSKWASRFHAGMMVSIQPALNYKGSMDSPGYSYAYCGGEATYIILPSELMLVDALLPFSVEGWYQAALSEPYSCVIGACHEMFRTSRVKHEHELGLKHDGRMAIIGGCGPMGLAMIDYAMAGPKRPSLLVVTDIDAAKINRARSIFEPIAQERGIVLKIVDSSSGDSYQQLYELTEGKMFDDVMVMVAHPSLLELGERLLAFNACLNFFAGPLVQDFYARLNYYDVHYLEKHIIGTSGGNTDDQKEALELMEQGLLHPAALITHVGGLEASLDATCKLPELGGGKKMIYTHIECPLFALDELPKLRDSSKLFAQLAAIVARHNGLWSKEAEEYLLSHCPLVDTNTRIPRKDT